MSTEVLCAKCGDICVVAGEHPKFFAWCDTCHDYAKGFNDVEYAADELGARIDEAERRLENR